MDGEIETGDRETGELSDGVVLSPARSQTDASCSASPTVKAEDWNCFSPSGVMIVIGIPRRIWRVIG
jgi:hypothetical protein